MADALNGIAMADARHEHAVAQAAEQVHKNRI
jgi:hypothetical protein